jgi:hypothetical protein
MPQDLRQSDASDRISGGDKETALTLLYFIREVFEQKRIESSERDSDVPRIIRPSKATLVRNSSSWQQEESDLPLKPRAVSPPKTRSVARPSASHRSSGSIHDSCEIKMNRPADKGTSPRRCASAPRMPSGSAQTRRSVSPAPPADVIGSSLPTEVRAEIIRWLETIGVTSASSAVRHREDGSRPAPLDDPWCNGVMLSELAAVLCKNGDRSLVKEVNNLIPMYAQMRM